MNVYQLNPLYKLTQTPN